MLLDIKRGLVTNKGAERYGVVISNGEINQSSTEKLRADMRKTRGKVKLFDRGFESIEELKSRCKAETGFEPPNSPKFHIRMQAAE